MTDLDYGFVSADSHIGTPPRLADELPPEHRQRVTHFEERSDGVYLVRPMPGGFGAMAKGGSGMSIMSEEDAKRLVGADEVTLQLAQGVKVDPEDDETIAGFVTGNVCEGARPSLLPEGRLLDMRRDGVVGEVLIGAAGFGALAEPDMETAWARTVNDWLADTYKDHLGQFAPGISLPLTDIDASVKEVERAAKLGLRPVLLPQYVMGHRWYQPEWEPLWEAIEAANIPISFHVGFSRWMMAGLDMWEGSTESSFVMVSLNMAEIISELVFGGPCGPILERHPGLQVVMTECSAGWLAWVMDFLDYTWTGRYQELSKRQYPGHPKLQAPPSHYIKRQVKATFMSDRVAIHNREITGTDCLLWGNDYPHNEGAFPYSHEWAHKQFAGVAASEAKAILHDNSAKVFGLTG
ncbi:MAG: amidohydrolase family protein [Acidimicrobiia bacterium]|nr:amidohydrolase family protein [Acidimicrobiia bacterium]